MSNFIIGWRNQAMTGAIVVSSSAPGLGGDQLQNDQGNAASAWQTAYGLTTGSILLVRAPGTSWRLFGLHNTNLTAAATVTWNVLNGATPVYAGISPPVVAGYRQAVHVAPAAVLGDRMQVNISDPTNPDNFLNIAGLFAGDGFQPARNMSYQSAPTRAAQVTTAQLRAGGIVARPDWVRRTFDLQLASILSSEMPSFQDLESVAWLGGNVLFVPDPAGTPNTDAIFGQCTPTAQFGYPDTTPFRRSWRATISERL